MTLRLFRISKFLGLVLLVSLALVGCDTYSETKVSQNRVQLEQTEFSETLNVKDLDEHAIATVARDYERYGDGVVQLTVLYDPSSKEATAAVAGSEAGRLSAALRKNGIAALETVILPVKEYGDEMHALIEYTAYNALPPRDCTQISGLESTKVETDPDYKLGCSVETVFAKQIARPKDLRGQGLDGRTDGQRTANIVDVYRAGTPNESLGGEAASE